MWRHASQTTLIALLLSCSSTSLPAQDVPADVFFERDVRPLLKAHCFQCHGENGHKEGNLDLRLNRFIALGGDSGPAIVAGQPDNSLLLQRVRNGEMPPGEGKQLKAADLEMLTHWIASGATNLRDEPLTLDDGPVFTDEERSYWAFQPVARPDVPQIDGDLAAQVKTPIDAFLLHSMQQDGWHSGFAAPADRQTILRRTSFDLRGLPPSPEELRAITAGDPAADSPATDAVATDAVVSGMLEQFLASPHYGERWGRHWLDIAGYADSEGYDEEDRVRSHAYRYRDYVIRSFNADKPFDLFIQEQLAGDEMVAPPYSNLSNDEIDKLTATGFLRMAPDGTASGGIDQDVARNQVMADTLQIVSTSLLGLTVQCAQCHDHRYDPIPQADYYRLRAIFEPAIDWKHWRVPAARQISLYTDADRAQAASIEARAVAVDQQRLAKAEEYITRTLNEELESVPLASRDLLRVAYRTKADQRTEQQNALLKEYPSVANISIGSLYLYDRGRVERAGKLDAQRKRNEQRFVAETAAKALSAVAPDQRDAVSAAAKTPADLRSPSQTELLQKYPAVLVTAATLQDFNPAAAAELEQDRLAAEELRNSKAADDLKRLADQAAEIRAQKPVEGFLRCLTEVPGTVPETFIFFRGDHEQPKASVAAADLSILPDHPEFPAKDDSLPSTGRRLAFAKHLTSGTHPLVARVIVNRIWLHHFGTGLVNSPSDFGVLGDRPTHPELLDWLAAEFVDSGWSVKHMHRLIMQSSAYRQSSVAPTSTEPDQRPLYSRFPLQRLDAETLRDTVLTVAGRLNTRMYGEPIPVMEDGVGRIVLGRENLDGERKPTTPISLEGEEFRRSVYVQVRRSRTLSLFETFDAATVNPNCEKRSFSTVTPQSLLMMNSDFIIERSDDFASRLIEASENDAQCVRNAWRIAYAAEPTDTEVADALEFITSQRNLRQQQDATAAATPSEQDARHHALSVFCQALMSSNRFLYVN